MAPGAAAPRRADGGSMERALEHWHPVLLARSLRRRPRAVAVGGREIVVFRTDTGALGALDGLCPHRRMPLEEGRVEGDRLVCPYHGWRFSPGGDAACPAEPGARFSAVAYDVVERHGAVWVKARGADAPLPEVGAPGCRPLCTLQTRFRAPLELVADNFAEMEHTGEAHLFFGYDTDRMASVELRTEVGDDLVRAVATGPQRRLPWAIDRLKRLFGSPTDDLFVDDATFRFSPVHSVADSFWIDARTGERRPQGLRAAVFLVPVAPAETDVFAFFFFAPTVPRVLTLLRPVAAWLLRHELECDRLVTEKVARTDPSLDGMILTRLDAPIRAIRERIDRIYWRRAALDPAAPAAPSPPPEETRDPVESTL